MLADSTDTRGAAPFFRSGRSADSAAPSRELVSLTDDRSGPRETGRRGVRRRAVPREVARSALGRYRVFEALTLHGLERTSGSEKVESVVPRVARDDPRCPAIDLDDVSIRHRDTFSFRARSTVRSSCHRAVHGEIIIYKI